jgi:hypothetical protein
LSAAGDPVPGHPAAADVNPDEAKRPERMFAQPVSGPAYRTSAKWMIGSTVLSLFTYGAQVLAARDDVPWQMLVLLAASAGVVLLSTWYMLTGRTTIDAEGIRQDWIFAKAWRWHEIVHAKHLRLPFTSRLVISTGTGPLKAIHGGCRELDDAFRTIAAAYRPR